MPPKRAHEPETVLTSKRVRHASFCLIESLPYVLWVCAISFLNPYEEGSKVLVISRRVHGYMPAREAIRKWVNSLTKKYTTYFKDGGGTVLYKLLDWTFSWPVNGHHAGQRIDGSNPEWFFRGNFHRLDGPAYCGKWYVHGKCVYDKKYDFDDATELGAAAVVCTKSFKEKLRRAGTIANRGVYVAVSDLGEAPLEAPMLGLFAGREFKAGELVTFYGGEIVSADKVKAYPPKLLTHTARIPGSDRVADGREFSYCFDSGVEELGIDEKTGEAKIVVPADPKKLAFLKGQRKLPAHVRRPFLPLSKLHSSLCEKVWTAGVGYMGNTKGRCGNNTKLHSIVRDCFGNTAVAIVATKPIRTHEEITYAYQNQDVFSS